MKSGLILITNKLENDGVGGREQLCKLNYDLLRSLYGSQLSLMEIEKKSGIGWVKGLSAFKGYIDGLDKATIKLIFSKIKDTSATKVFIDGSNLGEVARVIKNSFPDVEIYTFFHNVEARFFFGAFKQSSSIHAFAVFFVNYLAERKSVKYSDHIICLSKRDSLLLKRWYGKLANHIAPMSIQDKYTNKNTITEPQTKFALFVGGDFYANFAGIKWFVENVSPYIEIQTYIVGRGMENFKNELEINNNVKVIGEVDSLEEWYLKSYFVIAPIFDGSGMKTKTAEALMFGKKIIGTPEAFSGYEQVVNKAGYICHNAKDFIVAINNADEMVIDKFDNELREIYESSYSFSAAKNRLERILRI
jgi:glycosyltransferase involved in cell wall biosynthesis